MQTPRAVAIASLTIALSASAAPATKPSRAPAKPAPATEAAPPEPAAAMPSSNPPPAPTGGPCHSLITVIETLYKKQQFEAADVVLGLALNSPDVSGAEHVSLKLLEGILRMEAFQKPQANAAFKEALIADRQARLPDFAPPATRRLFEDVKAELPPLPVTVATATPSPPKKKKAPPPPPGPWAWYYPWIPIGVGGAAALTGGGFIFASHSINADLRAGSSKIASRDALDLAASQGKTFQTTGWVLAGVGTAVLVGGLAWKFGPEVMPMFTVQVSPTSGGFAVACSGVLP